MRARISSPPASTTPWARPCFTRICSTGAIAAYRAAARRQRGRERLGDRAHAAARETPGADGPVDAAHVVMQQHVGGTRRARPERRADDRAAGHVRLDDPALEVLIQQVGAAHGPEAQRVVQARLAELVEVPPEPQQLLEIARAPRGRIRRLAQQQRLDEAAVPQHVAHEAVVALGVAARMPRDLPPQRVVIIVQRQVPAAAHQGAAALVGDDLQSVARQLERTDDLGAQQAADVGAVRVGEAVVQPAAHRRAADVRIALQHQHVEAGARQIAGSHQAVVPGADHDHIVAAAARAAVGFPVQAGTRRLVPSAFSVRSTATSKAASVSFRHESSCAADMNHGSRESGSHRMRSSCSARAVAS